MQRRNEAQVLGRSAQNTDCGNCVELHRLNASNYAALLDDVNLCGRLLKEQHRQKNRSLQRKTAEKFKQRLRQWRIIQQQRQYGNGKGKGENKGETSGCTRYLDTNHDRDSFIWRKKVCTFCGLNGHSTATCGKLKKAMEASNIAPLPKPATNKFSTGNKMFKGKSKANMIAGNTENSESGEKEDAGTIHNINSMKHGPQV